MIRALPSALSVLIVMTALGSAAAQDIAANRYSMEKTEGGVIRLDTATGELSFCHRQADQMECSMAADERRGLKHEIDTLKKRVARLETSLAERPDQPGALPSDRELDRSMTVMEKFMRRLFKMVDDLNRDFNDKTEKKPDTDRGAGPDGIPEKT